MPCRGSLDPHTTLPSHSAFSAPRQMRPASCLAPSAACTRARLAGRSDTKRVERLQQRGGVADRGCAGGMWAMAYWQRAAPRGGIAPGFGSKGRRDRGTIRGPTATDGLSHRLLAALLRRLGPVASGEEAAAVQKRLRGWAERGTRSLPVWEAPRGRLGYWSGGIDRSDPADDQGDMAPCSRTLGAIRSAGRFRWRRGTMQVLVGWRAPSGSADVGLDFENHRDDHASSRCGKYFK